MALGPREFIEEVNKIYNIIDKRRTSSITKLGDISISDILEEVFEISAALQRLYSLQKTIDNLSEQETSNLLRKARFIALLGVCEFFKIYDNKSEYSFWEKFSQESGFTVNDNFIYKILEQALIDIKILFSKTRENILSVIALEANLSEHYIKDIIVLFGEYIKYFYPCIEIKEYLLEIKLEKNSLLFDSLPEESKNSIITSYKRLNKIENKVILIISELVSFCTFTEFSDKLLDYNNINSLIDKYSQYCKSDIYNILINDEIKKLFLSYIKGISIKKLILILNSLKNQNDDFEITLPNLEKSNVTDFVNSSEVIYGRYKFLDYELDVLPYPYLDIDFLCNLNDNQVNIFGNKIILKSNIEFDINIGNIEADILPSEIYKENNFNGFIWISDRPVVSTIHILSDTFETEKIEPTEKIIADLTLKLFEDEYTPSFKLLLSNLILISPDNSSSKIDIFNTDNYSIGELNIDKNGIGFLGENLYDINNKKPNILEFHFFNKDKLLNLKYFEPKISYILDDSILFNTLNKKVILPNENIEEKIERLYLFTTKNYENKWFNDVCEVVSYTPFGKWNVYEIIWVDRTKSLEINLDRRHKWKFNEGDHLHFEVVTNKKIDNSNLIKFKENHISSIDDIKIIISESDKIKDLDLRLSFNFNKLNHFVKVGYLNDLLGKNKNNNIIDSSLFLKIIDNYNPGRYDIEIFYKNKQLFSYTFFILPKFEIIEENNIYLEGDDIIISLSSNYPCFRNGKTIQTYLFEKKAKCFFDIKQNNIISSRKLPYFKKVRIYDPFTEFEIVYEPEIIGFRFIKDNKLFQANKISFYEIDKKSIILRNPLKEARLKVNNQLVKPVHSNNQGIAIENLSLVKNYLNKIDNDIVFITNKLEISFQIIYYPNVNCLYTYNNIYSNNQIYFFMSYQGPQNSLIKFVLEDIDAKPIEIKKVFCEDDLSPRFIKYDKEKKCFQYCL